MRVLAVRQPWASMIAMGYKTMEIRSRDTKILDENFGLYASRTKPKNSEIEHCLDWVERHYGSFPNIERLFYDLPRGKILGITMIKNSTRFYELDHFLSLQKEHMNMLSQWKGPCFGWNLRNFYKFENPIDFKATSVVWSHIDSNIINKHIVKHTSQLIRS